MQALRCCTITGVNEHTDLEQLKQLGSRHPLAEWAVVYDKERAQAEKGQGEHPRPAWIKEFLREADGAGLQTALHLSGAQALAFMREDEALHKLAARFSRVHLDIQADGLAVSGAKDLDYKALSRIFHYFTVGNGHTRVSIPHDEANAFLCHELRSNLMDFLVTRSQDGWPNLRELFGMRCGFGGGLGPDTLGGELQRISAASDGKSYWLMLDHGLKDAGGRLDLKRCEDALDQVAEHVMRAAVEAGSARVDAKLASPTQTARLDGFWLNWWSGVAHGHQMTVPPVDASRPTYLDFDGDFRGYEPLEYAHDLKSAVEAAGVGSMKVGNQWMGLTTTGEHVSGSSLQQAQLRALVLQTLGPKLPANPVEHPAFHHAWVGQEFTEERLQDLLPRKQRAAAPR